MPPSDLRGRALGVVLGGLAAQVGLGCIYLRAPLFLDIVEEFGWSRAEYSAAGAFTNVVIALASPVVGALTYRLGARPVLASGICLLGLCYAGLGAMQSYTHLVALNVALGLMVAALGDIAVGSVVSRWVVRMRGLALGIVYSGSNLGGLLVSLVAPTLLAVGTWRDAFLWVGAAAVALLLPAVLLGVREPPPGFVPPSARGRTPEPAADPSAGADPGSGGSRGDDPRAAGEDASGGGLGLGAARRTPEFWILAGSLFLFYFYYLGLNVHFVPFLEGVGLSKRAASASFGISVALGITAKVGIGLLADRWPAKSALLVNFAIVTLASLLLLGVPSPGFLPGFIAAHGIATAAQNVVYPLIVAWCFGVRHLAQIYGALMVALLPGGVLGPIFAGYVFDWLGSYTLAFRVFAALNVVSLTALCFLRSRRGAA